MKSLKRLLKRKSQIRSWRKHINEMKEADAVAQWGIKDIKEFEIK